MDFGVTDTGFVLKSFSDIMKDVEKRYKARLQDFWNSIIKRI